MDNKALQSTVAVHHPILASQTPLTSSCSGVWFKTKCVCRETNGGFRSRKSKLLAANLQLYRAPCREQHRGCGWDGHIGQGRWPANIRHSPSSSLGRHEVPGWREDKSCRKMQSAKHCVRPACSRKRKTNFQGPVSSPPMEAPTPSPKMISGAKNEPQNEGTSLLYLLVLIKLWQPSPFYYVDARGRVFLRKTYWHKDKRGSWGLETI